MGSCKELVDAVRCLEKQRDEGSARQPGKPWTVAKWLEHSVENIAKPVVSENTYAGYEVAVRVHLVPGIGRRRIDRLGPEHLESPHRRMQSAGSKAGTAHAGVRDGRLHDARHTAGTVLMLLGVPDRVIDQIMGWEPGGAARMRARYLHVTDPMLKEAARKIERAIWAAPENLAVDKDQDNAV